MTRPWSSAPMGACFPLPTGRRMNPLLDEQGELPRVEQPFEEIRRPEMGDREARPIEDLLGDVGVLAGIAPGMAIGRSLGEVDDRGDARFPGGLREIDGRVDEPGSDRVNQVRRIDAFHGRANRVDVEEVAHHDLGTLLLQCGRSVVLAMHHGADFEPTSDRFLGGGTAGVPGRARDQHLAMSHLNSPFLAQASTVAPVIVQPPGPCSSRRNVWSFDCGIFDESELSRVTPEPRGR